MSNISNYLETALLNHVFRATAYTSPTAVYVGLVSSSGTDSEMEEGTLTNEITGYTGNRKAVTFGEPSDDGEGKMQITNTAALDFEDMPACTVKYAIVTDSATKGNGNILYWCPLSSQKTVDAGDTFRIPAGNLVLKLY